MATTRTGHANLSPSSTSPTSVWEISELVVEIMKHNSNSRPALAACAAVSHGVSGSALEVLWGTMESLSPLFAILVKSIETISGLGHSWKKTFILSAPIDDQEWRRSVYYANFIRVYINREDNIDGMTSEALLARTQGHPLLSRLQELMWIRPIKHSSSLPLFLSPTIHSLFVDLSNDLNFERMRRGDDEARPDYGKYAGGVVLQGVLSRASHIRELTVHDATGSFTLETISKFRYLHTLTLHLVRDLRSLSSCLKPLISLESLMVGMDNDATSDQMDNLPVNSSPLPLEVLCNLHVVGPPRFVLAFLEHVHSPALQQLNISTACDDVIWRRCMKITASRFSNTLLSLEAWLHDTPNDTSVRSFQHLFASLYAIRTLQKLTIKELKRTKCLITTEDIANIAKAWPDLRSLALPWSKPEASSPQPAFPITALESIARTCRSLETLVLPLPDHSPLSDSTLSSAPSYDNNVVVLKLRGGKWKRKVREKCMRYLMHIFPRLDRDMIWTDEDYDAMIYRRR